MSDRFVSGGLSVVAAREHEAALLAASQHGVVSAAQLAELGFGSTVIARRVRSGAWRSLGPGVFAFSAAPPSFRQQVLAAVLSIPGAAASHQSAALLHGFRYLDRPVLAVTAPTTSQHRLAGVVVHRYSDHRPRWLTTVDGITTTNPARTLVDLGAVYGPKRLERVLDAALADGRSTLQDVVTTFNALARRGRHGIGRMRPLLEARGDGFIAPESVLEEHFIEFIDERGLPVPARQVRFSWRDELIGRADFAYPEVRLLIELDGRLGHTQLVDIEDDHRRDQRAVAAGWRVIRITWRQLHDHPDEVEEVLRAALGLAPA